MAIKFEFETEKICMKLLAWLTLLPLYKIPQTKFINVYRTTCLHLAKRGYPTFIFMGSAVSFLLSA